jgi:hypothetical protein
MIERNLAVMSSRHRRNAGRRISPAIHVFSDCNRNKHRQCQVSQAIHDERHSIRRVLVRFFILQQVWEHAGPHQTYCKHGGGGATQCNRRTSAVEPHRQPQTRCGSRLLHAAAVRALGTVVRCTTVSSTSNGNNTTSTCNVLAPLHQTVSAQAPVYWFWFGTSQALTVSLTVTHLPHQFQLYLYHQLPVPCI